MMFLSFTKLQRKTKVFNLSKFETPRKIICLVEETPNNMHHVSYTTLSQFQTTQIHNTLAFNNTIVLCRLNHRRLTSVIQVGLPPKEHDDVIKWKHFPRYWPFVRGIQVTGEFPEHNGQWRGALTFSLIHTLGNGRVNNGEAGDLRRQRSHYGVTVINIVYSNSLHSYCDFYSFVFRRRQ